MTPFPSCFCFPPSRSIGFELLHAAYAAEIRATPCGTLNRTCRKALEYSAASTRVLSAEYAGGACTTPRRFGPNGAWPSSMPSVHGMPLETRTGEKIFRHKRTLAGRRGAAPRRFPSARLPGKAGGRQTATRVGLAVARYKERTARANPINGQGRPPHCAETGLDLCLRPLFPVRNILSGAVDGHQVRVESQRGIGQHQTRRLAAIA